MKNTKSLIPVKSSVIQAYHYDDKTYTLRVVFRDGGQYEYYNVMPPVMSAVFDSGGSIGSRFMRQIAKSYRSERADPQ